MTTVREAILRSADHIERNWQQRTKRTGIPADIRAIFDLSHDALDAQIRAGMRELARGGT